MSFDPTHWRLCYERTYPTLDIAVVFLPKTISTTHTFRTHHHTSPTLSCSNTFFTASISTSPSNLLSQQGAVSHKVHANWTTSIILSYTRGVLHSCGLLPCLCCVYAIKILSGERVVLGHIGCAVGLVLLQVVEDADDAALNKVDKHHVDRRGRGERSRVARRRRLDVVRLSGVW